MTRLAVLTSHPIQYYGPLFRELAKEVDLHVFFAHQSTPSEQASAGFGIAFEWDVDLTSGYGHSFLRNVAESPATDHFFGCDTPEIGRYLRRGRFHALLVMGWHLKSYLQGLFAAKRVGIPVMVRGDSHLDTPRSRAKSMFKSLAFPRFLRLFDAVLFVGTRSRAYYDHYGYPSEQLFFSPHCVDTDWFAARATREARRQMRERLGRSPDTPLLLFAGRLKPFKRPIDLIAAAAQCRASGLNVEVIIAGDGELRRDLADIAARQQVPLHLLGFCNQTEMPAVYSASDCLVLPSDGRESWGLVANEALACGRPIIVSDACGCAPDLARDGRAGRRFPVGSVKALAENIQDAMAAPPAATEIAKVSKAYSLDAAIAGVVTALGHLQRGRI